MLPVHTLIFIFIPLYRSVNYHSGNAHYSGTPDFTSFARSPLLYWLFTGLVLIFYTCCLFDNLLQRISNFDVSAGTFII